MAVTSNVRVPMITRRPVSVWSVRRRRAATRPPARTSPLTSCSALSSRRRNWKVCAHGHATRRPCTRDRRRARSRAGDDSESTRRAALADQLDVVGGVRHASDREAVVQGVGQRGRRQLVEGGGDQRLAGRGKDEERPFRHAARPAVRRSPGRSAAGRPRRRAAMPPRPILRRTTPGSSGSPGCRWRRRW